MQTVMQNNSCAVEIRMTYRYRLLLLSLGLFVAPVAGFYAWIDIFPAIIRFSFAVIFLVFGLVALVIPISLITNRPILVIDDHGLKVGHTLIPWQDIDRFELFHLKTNPSSEGPQWIGIKLMPSSNVWAKLTWARRFFAKHGTISKAYPYSFSVEGVNMPPIEILRLLEFRHIQFKQMNNNDQ